jgi:hypothetical protein
MLFILRLHSLILLDLRALIITRQINDKTVYILCIVQNVCSPVTNMCNKISNDVVFFNYNKQKS